MTAPEVGQLVQLVLRILLAAVFVFMGVTAALAALMGRTPGMPTFAYRPGCRP